MTADSDTLVAKSDEAATVALAPLVAERYQILRWLGGGGMGQVYAARDQELDVVVALKVLRAGLTDDAVERFRREVRLTRMIQHPNVARMYDLGLHGTDKFLTMELVDGASLAQLASGHAVEWSKLQPLAIQLCAGLAEAHAQGVIHRDLKPDNVLVERDTNRAVLTDFGIARGGDDADVTHAGTVVGTPRYMSPEQFAGGPLDARSDLFSLGVMLFELASGMRPWDGDSPIQIAVARATVEPRSLAGANVPRELADLVMQCIELDPAKRPQTAAEIGSRLAACGSAPASRPTPLVLSLQPQTTKLAVLPVSCAPTDAYLADGLRDDLLVSLSSPTIHVHPGGASASADPREVGRELGVDHVVAAALRRTPSALRVTARLVSVADGLQIWAHRIDCSEDELLGASDELARAIAEALSTRVSSRTPIEPRAVDLYLRARAEMRRFWGDYADTAVGLLEQALVQAPSSSAILGALALARTQAWLMTPSSDGAARAEEAIVQGIAAGEGEAYIASAIFRGNTGDLSGCMAHTAKALIRAPMSARAHETAARFLVELGSTTEARQHFATACGLDPGRAQIIDTDLARLDALEGDWVSADRRITSLLRDPDAPIARLGEVFAGRLAGWRGDHAAMRRMTVDASPRIDGDRHDLGVLLDTAVASGTIEDAAWAKLSAMFGGATRPRRLQILGVQLVTEHAALHGNAELAVRALDYAQRLGLIDILWLDRCPLFADISDPRWPRLRDQVALAASRALAVFRAG